MNIQELIEEVGSILFGAGKSLPKLTMVTQFEDKEKTKPTKYVSHWDNANRIRVVMHEDIMELIKADVNYNGLGYKEIETITPVTAEGVEGKEPYTRIIIITPRNIRASF